MTGKDNGNQMQQVVKKQEQVSSPIKVSRNELERAATQFPAYMSRI